MKKHVIHLFLALGVAAAALAPSFPLQQAFAQPLQQLPANATMDVTTPKGCTYYLTFGLCGRPHAWRLVSNSSLVTALTPFIGKKVEMQVVDPRGRFALDKIRRVTTRVKTGDITNLANGMVQVRDYSSYNEVDYPIPGSPIDDQIVLIELATQDRRYEAFIRKDGNENIQALLLSVEEKSTPSSRTFHYKYRTLKNGTLGEYTLRSGAFMMIRAL